MKTFKIFKICDDYLNSIALKPIKFMTPLQKRYDLFKCYYLKKYDSSNSAINKYRKLLLKEI